MKWRFCLVAAVLAVMVDMRLVQAEDGPWHSSYEKALEEVKEKGRPVLMLFTGSDWCPPCQMMDRKLLDTDEFKTWAKENVVLLELDFPRSNPQPEQISQQNARLQQRFRVQGFPTIVFIDADEKELDRISSFRPDVSTKRWIGLANAIIAAGKPADPSSRQAKEMNWRDQQVPQFRAHWDGLEGRPAADLSVLSDWVQDEGKSWEELDGKVVLLKYWGTWCPSCRAATPRLVDLHKKFHDKGLVILGVHTAKGAEDLSEFVKEKQLPYSFAVDGDSALAVGLGVQYVPTYYVIDRKGRIRVAGAESGQFEQIIEAVLEETPGPAWLTDHEKAMTLAKTSGKPILANFTGSDWCQYCAIQDREVFRSEPFASWAKKNVVLLELDFPRRRQQPQALRMQNEQLAEKFALEDFPTVIFMNEAGEELGRFPDYVPGRGAAKWIEKAKEMIGAK